MMKFLRIGTALLGLVSCIWGTEYYDFQDAQQNSYRLCSLKGEAVLNPQSTLEKTCRTFIESELNNEEAQKNTRMNRANSTDEQISYFARFMEKATKCPNHHMLVLFKVVEEEYVPVGMGKVDALEELIPFLKQATIKDLEEKVGSLNHGYLMGGNMTQSYQNQGIVTRISTQVLDIILYKIYKERCVNDHPPYMYIGTLENNEAMNRVCTKVGMRKLNGEELRNFGTQDNPCFCNEYIFQKK